MKTLIVYYSLSGNNRLLVEELCKRFRCDAHELRPRKQRTKLDLFLIDAFTYRTPPNDPIPCDLLTYASLYRLKQEDLAKLAPQLDRFVASMGGPDAFASRSIAPRPPVELPKYMHTFELPELAPERRS